MALYQLIYSSEATRPMGDQGLAGMVAQARASNYNSNITGLLLCASSHYLQVLEGEQKAVEQLYSHISHDPRHTQLAVLLGGTVPRRLFPGWNMELGYTGAAELTRLVGYMAPEYRAALLPSTYNVEEVMADLLREFIDAEAEVPALRPVSR